MPDAAAAIFVAPVSVLPASATEALGALYDLTPAESRVMIEIARGQSRAETAEALGVELATVKAHLGQVFAKTGTHRQSQLVALNASVALPLRS
jgi:DNA-binding CsgD family transcriptional regulator